MPHGIDALPDARRSERVKMKTGFEERKGCRNSYYFTFGGRLNCAVPGGSKWQSEKGIIVEGSEFILTTWRSIMCTDITQHMGTLSVLRGAVCVVIRFLTSVKTNYIY